MSGLRIWTICSSGGYAGRSYAHPCHRPAARCVRCENQSGSAVDRDIGEEGRRSGPSHVASAGGGRCCTRWCSTRRRCGRGSRSGVTIRETRVRRGLVRWCDATAGGSVGNGVAASCTGAAQGDDGVCRLSARKCEAARRAMARSADPDAPRRLHTGERRVGESASGGDAKRRAAMRTVARRKKWSRTSLMQGAAPV